MSDTVKAAVIIGVCLMLGLWGNGLLSKSNVNEKKSGDSEPKRVSISPDIRRTVGRYMAVSADGKAFRLDTVTGDYRQLR